MKTKAGIRIGIGSTCDVAKSPIGLVRAIQEFNVKRAVGIRIQSTYLTIELENQ